MPTSDEMHCPGQVFKGFHCMKRGRCERQRSFFFNLVPESLPASAQSSHSNAFSSLQVSPPRTSKASFHILRVFRVVLPPSSTSSAFSHGRLPSQHYHPPSSTIIYFPSLPQGNISAYTFHLHRPKCRRKVTSSPLMPWLFLRLSSMSPPRSS